MTYLVKETFYSLQGEGYHAGRPAVFCRFAGCNLWTGRETERARAACRFCDTDFVGTNGAGGGRFETAELLAESLTALWPIATSRMFVVLTGGEPLLQVDEALLSALHRRGFDVAVETNGTMPASPSLDWVCVSPKAGTELVQQTGDELKAVWPQSGLDMPWLETLGFRHLFVQPMDGADRAVNTLSAVAFCKANPRWSLSLQTHKFLGIR